MCNYSTLLPRMAAGGAACNMGLLILMMMAFPPATVEALISFSAGWKSAQGQMLSRGSFRFGFFDDSGGALSLAVYLQFESDNDRPVVWSARNDSSSGELGAAQAAPTLQSNAFLQAVGYGTAAFVLRLDDGTGHTVWQVEGVVAMDLQDNGNLVLYNDSTHQTIFWQSFHHPTNTLLKGQSLIPGMQLTSNSGDYSVVVYPGGLIGVANHIGMVPSAQSSSLPYWFVALNGSFDNGNFTQFGRTDIREALLPASALYCSPHQAHEGSINATLVLPVKQSVPGFQLQYSTCGSVNLTFNVGSSTITASVDFITLDDDGYLRAFNILNGSGLNAIGPHTQPGGLISFPLSPITNYLQEPLFPCDVPNACTSYGICFPASQPTECKCPSAASLHTVDFQQVGQGCEPANPLPISCADHPKSVEFVEIQNTTFISMLISGWNYTSLPLTACLDLCRNSCSCVAVFFQHNSSLCLPVSRMLGLLAIDDSNFSAYLKIPVSQGHRFQFVFLVIGLVLLLALLAAFVVVWRFYCRRRRSESDSDDNSGLEDAVEGADFNQVLSMLPARFSYKELKKATGGFTQRLGSGAFGSVYEGELDDGRRVAVKKLNSAINMGTKQFLAEVATIGRVDHVHVVRLFGFCYERSRCLLVYECMPNGSLDKWLFIKRPSSDAQSADDGSLHVDAGRVKDESPQFLDWKMRLDIAIGAGRGLSYLHNECTQPILHLDIKPENILLDSHFMPKISDFGMSRLMDREASCVVTQARGTPGYMAPELFMQSTVSLKCDVYSFGMVLLELACGRRIYDTRCPVEHLPAWVVAKHREGKLIEVVDRDLTEGEAAAKFDPEEAERVILTALWCIQQEPTLRPSAGGVVRMLTGDDPVPDLPPTKVPQRLMSFEYSTGCSTTSNSSLGLGSLQ